MKKSIVRVLALVLMLTLVITSSAAALKLQKNDKSDNVRRLQQALTQLGYYSGTVDGSFGSGTKAAVSAFQQANSLTVDGIAGSATIALLEKQTGIDIDGNSSSSSSTAAGLFKGDYSKLQYTSSGSRVRVLQQALKDLGFTISKVDGVFGQSTFEAVMAFQKATGLTVDGKAGKNTLVKLESYFDSNGNVTQPMITPKPTADLDNIAYGIPTRTLREGMGGQDVLYTQDRLAALGYLTGISDGQYGAATKAAVLAFQKKNGLSADGVLGTNTRKRLFSEGAIGAKETSQPDGVGERKLTLGMKGDDVKSVQTKLIALGYLTGKADGVYGTATESAIRRFQTRNGLTSDGICGEDTVKALYSSAAIDAGSSVTPSPKPVDESAPTRILRPGMSGDDVKSVQSRLDKFGYYSGALDGIYGAATVAAVQAFQARNGLTADGKVGANTVKILYSSNAVAADPSAAVPTPTPTQSFGIVPTRTLREGSSGDDVKSVQSRLKALGYYTGTVDGNYGTGTMAAVASFQLRNNLSADGVAGKRTYKKLYSSDALAAISTPTSTPTTGVTRPTRLLYSGCTGDDVKSVQQRLKDLGYLTDKVDGKYGANTVAAMRAFQLRNGLTGSGNGDTATYTILYSVNAITAEGKQVDSTTPTVYTNLKVGATGDAVLRLQQALSNLRYTVTINGTYDETTRAAVLAFQKRNGLAPDGIAGVNTQTKLYTGDCVTGDTALPDENQNGGTGNNGASFGNGPAKSQIKLQMWYTEIKPTIKSGQTVLVYEPRSGSSFRLRFYSLGRHADSEPLTAQDTAIMKAAWGGKFSWDEKPVYVLLPNGTWVLASMHCMPHLSGSIKDNDFDGHLCVHFPRTLEETIRNGDTKNGVRHQKDIRKAWKALTGEDITW